MDAHLDFEDAEVLPRFERHFSAEEYTELDDQAAKALGLSKQAAFTVPFIASMLDPDDSGPGVRRRPGRLQAAVPGHPAQPRPPGGPRPRPGRAGTVLAPAER